MPYARRDEIRWLPGHYYHLYNRGARQLSIFRDEQNYFFVLSRIKKYSAVFNLTVIAYCLMPNHYHLLVRQNGEQAAGLLPQRVFNAYSKAYNNRYGHIGTLFERRYLAKHLDSESHLLHLCRYIHANPVMDGLVANPQDWIYSNYAEWIGTRAGTLVDRKFIQECFSSPGRYIEFVWDYIFSRQPSNEISS